MTKQLEALIAEARLSASIMELIASFEPQDIDGDDVDLRFEVDGFDTGCNVSLVEQCGKASEQLIALITALEREVSMREQNLSIKLHMSERIAELEASPLAYDQQQRDTMNSIVAKAMKNNLERGDLVMADIFAATMELMRSGFRTNSAPSITAVCSEASPLAVKLPAPNFKKLAEEIVDNLVDCGGADDSDIRQYLEWTERTCRAAFGQVEGE